MFTEVDESFDPDEYPGGYCLLFLDREDNDCQRLLAWADEKLVDTCERVCYIQCDPHDRVDVERDHDVEVHPSLYLSEEDEVIEELEEIMDIIRNLS